MNRSKQSEQRLFRDRRRPALSRTSYSELPVSSKSSSRIQPKASVLSVISCSTGLLSGCSRAPTFDIIGSFFPAWLVRLFVGILLAVFVRWLLLRLKVAIVLPILVYPSLAALFTFLLWLIYFS